MVRIVDNPGAPASRLAVGCMRLSVDPDRDDTAALATLAAARDAGLRLFDTAHAYARDEADLGHNERLLGRALGGAAGVRIVTKCGMRRDGGAWIPDGRARRILDDARGSRAALGDVPIDTLLLHAPDPRTSLATSARALVRAAEDVGAARLGVSNVSRKQLEELAAHAPIASVEVALGGYDDLALRGGVVAYCMERGIEVLAHAPFGGPKRVLRLARDGVLASVASELCLDRSTSEGGGSPPVSALEVFLAYMLALPGPIVPVVGARRPTTVESLVRASRLALPEAALARLDARFPVLATLRRPRPAPGATTAAGPVASHREVVLLVGIPGAGKSRAAQAYVARGYERLNRDLLGGTLRGIAGRLDQRLRDGAQRVVLDNTYVTRATRSDVLRIAHAHGVTARCVFFDTPPHEAQVNAIQRLLQRFGRVLEPTELARHVRQDAAAIGPSAIFRMTRDLERPQADEGFVAIETVAFQREHDPEARRPGLLVSLDTAPAEVERLLREAPDDAACLLFAWRPGLDEASRARAESLAAVLAEQTSRVVEVAFCTHPGGPPVCWCRPPLPGPWLAFARRHGIDSRKSALHSRSATDRAMARACGLGTAGPEPRT